MSHIQAFTAPFVSFMQINYTAQTLKPFTGLYSGFPVDLPHSSAHNTASTQAAYYNKVYKGAPLLWIHARRGSTSQTVPARRVSASGLHPVQGSARRGLNASHTRRLAIWHTPPGGAVQRQGHGGRAEQLAACRRVSFSGFRPIANRGQQ